MARAGIGIVRLLRDFERPFLEAEKSQREAQVGLALLIIGDLIERFEVRETPQRLHGVAGTEEIGINLRQQQVRKRVLVIQFGGLPQSRDRVGMASCLVVRDRGVYLGTRVVRLHHAGAQERVQRRLRTALLEPQQAQASECDVIGRIGLQSARERSLCGVEAIDKGFKRPKLAFVACAGGVELERLQ